MRHVIIGTAGHVDHGKTSLIRALTGIDTDRLAEEKARGLSIELGFAYFDLPGGRRAGIVDVPGHERFVDTMVAGVHGIDLVLFVVSAREGVQPQTVEHLQILDLLGVRHGILVVTMRDLVTEEELEFAIEEARETFAGTTLDGIPAVAVSSVTGEGLDLLRAEIERLATALESEEIEDGIPRLPIDRVFTMEGFGVIVTGTLRGGSLAVDDRVLVMPSRLSARIRNVQVHNAPVARAESGQRTALNLAGIERAQVRRGDVVTLPDLSRTATNLDASLRIVDDYPRIVEHWHRARLHIGTREVFCRVVLLMEREGILPGTESVVQLRPEEPILAVRGDRYILRDDSIRRTLGGGRVLDPLAPRHRRFTETTRQIVDALQTSDDVALLRHLLAREEDPFLAQNVLPLYVPMRADDRAQALATWESDGVLVCVGDRIASAERYAALERAVETHLAMHHRADPTSLGLEMTTIRTAIAGRADPESFDALIDRMVEAGRLAREGRLVRLASHEARFTGADAALRDRLLTRFREAGLSTPSVAELRDEWEDAPPARIDALVRILLQLGELVRIDDDYTVHREAYEEAIRKLRHHLRTHGAITIGEFRELTGASRKYAVPFLEHCDHRGWTVRDGNARRGRRTFVEEEET